MEPTLEEKVAKKVGEDVQGLLTKHTAAIEDKNKATSAEIEARIKTASEEWQSAIEKTAKADDLRKIQDHLNKIETETKRLGINNPMRAAVQKTFATVIESIISDERFGKLQVQKGKASELFKFDDMDLKSFHTKATSTIGNSIDETNGEIIAPTMLPGIVYNPSNTVRVRQLIAQGNTNSNAVRMPQEKSFTNNTSVVAEGTQKPESQIVLEVVDFPVRKIANTFRFTDELLDDVPAFRSYVTMRATDAYLDEEDDELLYGNGTGQHIEGLMVAGDVYSDAGLAVPNTNRYDILANAVVQIRKQNVNPTAIVISPTDDLLLRLTKDSTGQYIFPAQTQGGQINVLGVPVYVVNQMKTGDFMVGAPRTESQIFDRKGITINFYDQDRDNVVFNLVTMVIEGRLALAVYRTYAFRIGSFASALALGSA